MTLKLVDGQTNYKLSFNIPNALGAWTLSLESQLSHLDILEDIALTTVVTNDRYTEFSFDIPVGLPDEHKNGIYNYTVTNGADEETGLLKLVTGSGSTDGYTAYQSDNEEREGPVYYRPQY